MKIISVLSVMFFSGAMIFGANAMAESHSKPHTWHTVRALDGQWVAKLQMLNESGSFVTREDTALTAFTLSPSHSQDYGFKFAPGADFDIAYTLTLTQTNAAMTPQFVSKACVYVVTASGPAKPDIRVSSFNGAKCDWNVVAGIGEDFTVG